MGGKWLVFTLFPEGMSRFRPDLLYFWDMHQNWLYFGDLHFQGQTRA